MAVVYILICAKIVVVVYKVKLFIWSFVLQVNLVELIPTGHDVQERAAVSSHLKK
jgi:hypothetical protein